MIKQISVLVENKSGQAYKPIKVLGDAGVDICAISVADTIDFGILRIITRDNDKAVEVLKQAGCTVNLADLVGAVVENEPGGLANLLTVFEKEGINIEYFYSFLPRKGEEAIMFFKVEETATALEKLKKHGVKLVEKSI
ncbi:MAG: hypothetical protein LBU89_11575 [Fibromonadaceae bacterium]|jgi:hypothetical protein|nr:hypothetical protein [Fibromonadaceae bacterium]